MIKEKLVATLLRLGQESELKELTVSHLIGEAGVARASFYRHFKGIPDLVEHALEEIRQEFWKQAPVSSQGFLDRQFLIYAFTFYGKYAPVILSVSKGGRMVDFSEILKDSMVDSFGDMPAQSLDRYSLYFDAGALSMMTLVWLQEGQLESPEQLADLFLTYRKRLDSD